METIYDYLASWGSTHFPPTSSGVARMRAGSGFACIMDGAAAWGPSRGLCGKVFTLDGAPVVKSENMTTNT